MKVRLEIPQEHQHKCKYPNLHGEHYGYSGRVGEIIASCPPTGAWVMFDAPKYVGCPIAWLKRA